MTKTWAANDNSLRSCAEHGIVACRVGVRQACHGSSQLCDIVGRVCGCEGSARVKELTREFEHGAID